LAANEVVLNNIWQTVNSINYFRYYTDVSRITVCVGQLSMPKASYYNSIIVKKHLRLVNVLTSNSAFFIFAVLVV